MVRRSLSKKWEKWGGVQIGKVFGRFYESNRSNVRSQPS
jgi:hypothetical protein